MPRQRRADPPPPEWTPEKILLVVVGLILGGLIAAFKLSDDGHYAGGEGSSHKGGHYQNDSTGDHYHKR